MNLSSNRFRIGLLLTFTLGIAGIAYFGNYWKLVSQCSQLMSDQNWPELDRIAEVWSHQQPECGTAWWYRAQVAIHAEHWNDAAELLARVRDDDSQALAGRSQLADLQLNKLNQPLAAVETDRRLLHRFPRSADSRDRLIRFFVMTFRRAELIDQAREAIRLGCDRPMTYYYLVSANFLYDPDHYAINSKWLVSEPDNEQFQVVQSLWVAHSKMDSFPQEAPKYVRVPKLVELLERYPNNLELLRYQAEEWLLNGDVERVGEALRLMPSNAVNEASYWLLRSWLQLAAGDLDAADAEARHALKLDPFYWRVSHQLADISRQRGDASDAQKALEIRHWEEVARLGQDLEDKMNVREAPAQYRQSLLRIVLAYVELCGELDISKKMRRQLDEAHL